MMRSSHCRACIQGKADDEPPPEQPPTPDLMGEYEQKAETAYAQMYDAQPWDEKDLKDDALFYLARAIEVAEALGLAEEEARLRARVDNIMGVYNSQFRGNWR
jgi:hypothetical protein